MFNRKSIYALNKKDPNAIVYPDADGNLIRLTRDDFASEEEFLRWKDWSDENFHAEDNSDVAEDKRKISLDDLSEEALAVPALDVIMENHHIQAEKHRSSLELVMQIKEILTETQFRRLWMYLVHEMTEAEIAAIEGSAQQQISKSIKSAEKKIKKIFQTSEKQGVKPPQKR